MIANDNPSNVLRIERRFDAPPAFVYALWTTPALLRPWWGPEGFRLATCEIDFRPGGRWRFNMVHPDREHWTSGVYHEMVPAERLVFSYNFDEYDVHSVVSIRLEAEGEATRMRFCQTGFPDAAERDGHGGGWGSTFRILEDALLALNGIGSVWPALPPQAEDGVARDLEAARQRFEAGLKRDP
jgi:uncharacterized protein YndB with AHSA1/START domain